MKITLIPILSLAAMMTAVHAGRDSAPVSTVSLESNAKSYTLLLSEFSASQELMDEALSSGTPYETLRFAAKAGKAKVRTFIGRGILGGAPGKVGVSSQIPVYTVSPSTEGANSVSSVAYRDVAVYIDFSLASPEGAFVVAKINYRSSAFDAVVDGKAPPEFRHINAEGALKLERGISTLLVSGDGTGGESPRSRAVFVRADW